MEFPSIETLGPRIMICGPSNSGKSTLARAIGRKLEVPAVHLDLLWHQPHTDWLPRPREEFSRLHSEALAGESWVIEGNYFAFVTERLQRATGIVFLGSNAWLGLVRYVRRTLFETGRRAGQLEGGIDRLNWKMARFILIEQPPKRVRDRTILQGSGLPMVEAGEMRQLAAMYRAWNLPR